MDPMVITTLGAVRVAPADSRNKKSKVLRTANTVQDLQAPWPRGRESELKGQLKIVKGWIKTTKEFLKQK